MRRLGKGTCRALAQPNALQRPQDAREPSDHEQGDRAADACDDVRLERTVAQLLDEQNGGHAEQCRREHRDPPEPDPERGLDARLRELPHRGMQRCRRPEHVRQEPEGVDPVAARVGGRVEAVDLVRGEQREHAGHE